MRMSNLKAMGLFKEAEEIKNNTDLTEKQISKQVRTIHDTLAVELAFLVYSNVRIYSRFSNYEDLIQEGNIGLLKAIAKFKYYLFPNFFVFANLRIRSAVKHAASRFDVVYSPTRERVVYSDTKADEADDLTPESLFFTKEQAEQLHMALGRFSTRDGEIVKRLFGLGKFKQHTLRDIGSLFDLSHERVRQISNNVISKLRKNQRLGELQQ